MWDRKSVTTLQDLAAACAVAVSNARQPAQCTDAPYADIFPDARLFYVSGHSVYPTRPIPKRLHALVTIDSNGVNSPGRAIALAQVKNVDFIRDQTQLVVSPYGADFERVGPFFSRLHETACLCCDVQEGTLPTRADRRLRRENCQAQAQIANKRRVNAARQNRETNGRVSPCRASPI